MNNRKKNRFIQSLIKLGKKCKWLTYPIIVLMVLVISLCHTIKKIWYEVGSHKVRTRVVCGTTIVALVFTTFVWPTLAEETLTGPDMEVVAEENIEPEVLEESETTEEPETVEEPEVTEAPDMTEEPEVTEQPEVTEEPANTIAPETTLAPEGEETPEQEKEEVTEAPTAETTSTPEVKEEVDKIEKIEKASKEVYASEPVENPTITKQPALTSTELTYGDFSSFDIAVEVTKADPANERLVYQWYQGVDGEDATAMAGETKKKLTIPASKAAGTYEFFCRVISVSLDDDSNVSDAVESDHVTLKIKKATPTVSDFVCDSIRSSYYYTGYNQSVEVQVKSGVVGMGNVTCVYYQEDDDNTYTYMEQVGVPYQVQLRVAEGTNYESALIETGKTVTIRRIATPSTAYYVQGEKGNKVDGNQWFKGAITITPPTGYQISTTETDFRSKLEYTEDGEDVGPAEIYLRDSSGYITDAIPFAAEEGKLSIDTKAPTGNIIYSETPFFGTFFNKNVTVTISPEETGSGIDKQYYYKSEEKFTDAAEVVGTRWVSGSSFLAEEDQIFYVAGKLIDKAGNVGFVSPQQVIIDTTKPTLATGNKAIGDGETKSYFADVKTFVASDDHIERVIVKKDGVEWKTFDTILNNGIAFDLTCPETEGATTTYNVQVIDVAGNSMLADITMKNPYFDITVTPVDFGTATYGYEAVEAQEIVVSKGSDPNSKTPVVESIRLEGDSKDCFEVVSNDSTNGFKVRPVMGLAAGTYTCLLRVNYNEEVGSTTTATCTFQVEKAVLNVVYEGQVAYYNTIPNFTDHIILNASELKNGDTKEEMLLNGDLVMPEVFYMDENGVPTAWNDRRTPKEPMALTLANGSATNYELQYTGGSLGVEWRKLDGYTISGTKGTLKKGDSSNPSIQWYTSNVGIVSKPGYQISLSDEPDSFVDETTLEFTEETAKQYVRFFVKDKETGEISLGTGFYIGIDKTEPTIGNGEGIIVALNPWKDFLNNITFDYFFNDTKSVTISGSDSLSGIDSIQYYMTEKVLSQGEVASGSAIAWNTYESGFELSPAVADSVIIYAKITNGAGISKYISTAGMVFDDKVPDIDVIEGKNYVTEEKAVTVFDKNLKKVTVYEGTDTTVSGTAVTINQEGTSGIAMIPCPEEGSKEYTIIAIDSADNMDEKTFTITKPIYDIEAQDVVMKKATYGAITGTSVAVDWKNTELANTDAVVWDVEVSDEEHFDVQYDNGTFYLVPKGNLHVGNYRTQYTLHYSGGNTSKATCTFTVDKAKLTVTYTNQEAYYNTLPDFAQAIEVTGFVNDETPETASGYKAPMIEFEGRAKKTMLLTPSAGYADDYEFSYVEGVLSVTRRKAATGENGLYQIAGTVSDSGWYVSDITITPESGFSLALDGEGNDLAEQIVLTKDTASGQQRFCVYNNATGELYEETVFDYRKDVVSPVVAGVKDGVSYEENVKQVNVSDAYLSSVTVNGKAQTIKNGVATFTLVAEQESTVYVIVATDYAGNVTTSNVTLKQPGMSNGDGEDDYDSIDEIIFDEGKVKKNVKIYSGAPNTLLTTSINTLSTGVLSKGERKAVADGSNAKIELHIKSIDGTVSQAEKALIAASLGNYKAGEYLDITLWKKVGSNAKEKVTETKNPLTISVTIPSSLRNKNTPKSRKYMVLRIHDGEVTTLSDRDSVDSTITFATDRFSTYVLAYKDSAKNSEASSNTLRGAGGIAGLPDMGDGAPLMVVIILFVLSFAGIISTMTMKGNDKRK